MKNKNETRNETKRNGDRPTNKKLLTMCNLRV
jgi:hypothetical protein